ncbi:uncharacterized protein LOC143273001 isoform X2 [Peromyscus maniculatus bairdii]|uniref:uncharacterized protein LOC143273001 isoform X2 n=1 Tax=Peromyscus maniculatus bairdii TaxID=230844 RepID=UPI003FD222BC
MLPCFSLEGAFWLVFLCMPSAACRGSSAKRPGRLSGSQTSPRVFALAGTRVTRRHVKEAFREDTVCLISSTVQGTVRRCDQVDIPCCLLFPAAWKHVSEVKEEDPVSVSPLVCQTKPAHQHFLCAPGAFLPFGVLRSEPTRDHVHTRQALYLRATATLLIVCLFLSQGKRVCH